MRFRELGVGRSDGEIVRAARVAAKSLRAGALLAHPTSTVYGLGAEATTELDEEISRLKGHAGARPLIRLARSARALLRSRPRARWDDRCERLASAFWPGPLTMVLDDGTSEGLAVRVDSHPLIMSILEEYGGLLSSTSLNRAAGPPAKDPEAAREILAKYPPSSRKLLFLNAGPLPRSSPSTLLDLRSDPALPLRVGALPLARVEDVLGLGSVARSVPR